MRTNTLPILLSLCLAASILSAQDSAGSGWNDTFSGNIMGTATTMKLQVNGGKLSGEVDASGYRYTLSGTVAGKQSQGQFYDPQTQGAMNYMAVLNEGQLDFTLENPVNGQSQQFLFTRGGAAGPFASGGTSPQEQSGSPQFERDSRIVGSWSYTDSYTSGEYSFAAQWKLIVNPDGTYLYGEGRVLGGGGGISGDSGSGDVTRGQWGTRDGIIYTNEGYGWQPYCRYTTNGGSLLMEFGDGSRQLWKRTN